MPKLNRDNMQGFICDIIETFEEFLEEKGITIENPEKQEAINDGEDAKFLANIYGTDYGWLQSEIEASLKFWELIPKDPVEHRRSIKENAFWGADKPPVPVDRFYDYETFISMPLKTQADYINYLQDKYDIDVGVIGRTLFEDQDEDTLRKHLEEYGLADICNITKPRAKTDGVKFINDVGRYRHQQRKEKEKEYLEQQNKIANMILKGDR